MIRVNKILLAVILKLLVKEFVQGSAIPVSAIKQQVNFTAFRL